MRVADRHPNRENHPRVRIMFPFRRLFLLPLMMLATAVAQNAPLLAGGDSQPEPVSIGILVDNTADSHSAREVRDAVKAVVNNLRDDDEYAIVSATDRVAIAQEITDDPALATKAVGKVRARRHNLLFDGIDSAVEYLKQNAGNDRKALIVL